MKFFERIKQALGFKKTIVKKTKYARQKSVSSKSKAPRKTKFSEEFKEKIIKEYLAGGFQHVLARKYNVSQAAICRWVKNYREKAVNEKQKIEDLNLVCQRLSLEDTCDFLSSGEAISFLQYLDGSKEHEGVSELIIKHPDFDTPLKVSFKDGIFMQAQALSR